MHKLRLTETIVARLKPDVGKVQTEFTDALMPGLLLVVGMRSKTWQLRYSRGGVRRRVRLGAWPGVPASEARGKAAEFLSAVAGGADPLALPAPRGFGALLAEFQSTVLPSMAEATRREWRRLLRREIAPRLGQVDLAQPRAARQAIEATLDEIGERAPVVSNRVRALVRRIVRWGSAKGMVPPETAGIVANLAQRSEEPSRSRVLSPAELRAIWAAIDEEPRDFRLFWRLCLLTLARRSEILGLRADQVDLAERLWTPASREGRHRVPLSGPAFRLVSAAVTLAVPGGALLEGDSGPLRNVQRSAHRLRGRSGVTDLRVADLRRTGAALLADVGVPPEVTLAILGDSEPGANGEARGELLPRMRDALEALAARLAVLVAPAA